MRTASMLAAIGLVAVTALPALAQTNPYRRNVPRAPEAYTRYDNAPVYSPRASSTYSVPPGYSGTIRWNTPNADGNFGGPGGGGRAGSPGG